MNSIQLQPAEISAISSSVIVTLGTIWGVICILRGTVKPILASWIINGTAILLSAGTYWTSSNHSLVGGALNITSTVTILAIFFSTLYMNLKENVVTKFTPFQVWCLVISAIIALVWVIVKFGFGKTGFVPNILTQALMVVAYIVNIQKVWRADSHKESVLLWWCVFIASVIAIYTAHLKHDALAYVYAIRSTLMCGVLLFALHRIGWRTMWGAVETTYAD